MIVLNSKRNRKIRLGSSNYIELVQDIVFKVKFTIKQLLSSKDFRAYTFSLELL